MPQKKKKLQIQLLILFILFLAMGFRFFQKVSAINTFEEGDIGHMLMKSIESNPELHEILITAPNDVERQMRYQRLLSKAYSIISQDQIQRYMEISAFIAQKSPHVCTLFFDGIISSEQLTEIFSENPKMAQNYVELMKELLVQGAAIEDSIVLKEDSINHSREHVQRSLGLLLGRFPAKARDIFSSYLQTGFVESRDKCLIQNTLIEQIPRLSMPYSRISFLSSYFRKL